MQCSQSIPGLGESRLVQIAVKFRRRLESNRGRLVHQCHCPVGNADRVITGGFGARFRY